MVTAADAATDAQSRGARACYVLGAILPDLRHALYLLGAADDGVQLALCGLFREVRSELLQRRSLVGPWPTGCPCGGSRANSLLALPNHAHHLLGHRAIARPLQCAGHPFGARAPRASVEGSPDPSIL